MRFLFQINFRVGSKFYFCLPSPLTSWWEGLGPLMWLTELYFSGKSCAAKMYLSTEYWVAAVLKAYGCTEEKSREQGLSSFSLTAFRGLCWIYELLHECIILQVPRTQPSQGIPCLLKLAWLQYLRRCKVGLTLYWWLGVFKVSFIQDVIFVIQHSWITSHTTFDHFS